MKGIVAFFVLAALFFSASTVCANENAIIPAYACVSKFHSSMKQYKELVDKQNRAGARKLLRAEKVFLSPKDVKVEVVALVDNIAKVRLHRLNEKAQPVALYFWTLSDQLRLIP